MAGAIARGRIPWILLPGGIVSLPTLAPSAVWRRAAAGVAVGANYDRRHARAIRPASGGRPADATVGAGARQPIAASKRQRKAPLAAPAVAGTLRPDHRSSVRFASVG